MRDTNVAMTIITYRDRFSINANDEIMLVTNGFKLKNLFPKGAS